jgi:hypothetical protein
MRTRPLRLMVYDRTCVKNGFGLSTAWSVGSSLYRGLRRLDATFGARTWEEALRWLSTFEPSRSIEEIQYWGHGRWGRVLIANDALDASALRNERHPLHAALRTTQERLVPGGEALVWLRTCEAFGANVGIDFAQALADGLGAKVAGHTFIIGALQSGLRALRPGCRPSWSPTEGIAKGTAADPKSAFGSTPNRPRTISCFSNVVPDVWLEEDSAPAIA